MKKFSLAELSVRRPAWVFAAIGLVTALFLIPFPMMKIDTNPKNMLPPTSPVRVWNAEVQRTFGLYEDVLVVGVVNPAGIYNSGTLGKIKAITDGILKLKGVSARDVSSLSTIDNIQAGESSLSVAPLMQEVPATGDAISRLEKDLLSNSMLVDRIASRDGKTSAIYVPLDSGANGKVIADSIREIVRKVTSVSGGDERIYLAGDPVARDTFGAVMFKLMGMFSPVAGVIMFVAMFIMFRNLALCASMMAVAMISIIWSMGLIIALGFPIHIMSSMAPVFLMAIATDSIHIFNEFYFQYQESGDKRSAILRTMAAVGRPVKFTALATATGFAVLMFMQIIPVKVFGGLIAFGTVSLRILSFTFIPAILSILDEKKIKKAALPEDPGQGPSSRILGALANLGASRPRMTAAFGILILLVSIIGITKITVNNNMVEWFTESNEIRQADKVMNAALGGTSLGYLIVSSKNSGEDIIKDPEAVKFIDGLQRHLEKLAVVGKTSSISDIVKRVNQALHKDDPAFYVVPEAKNAVGQYLFLFSMSAKPTDLRNMVDEGYQSANIWVQLKSWDAKAMEEVITAAKEYQDSHPTSMIVRPAGTAYFNMVWNKEVLGDMVRGFLLALLIVCLILALNFHSLKWALIGYVPLVFTIIILFGCIGYLGKDFDMPIAVLSCLSLGMAVDFAIHFINRFRIRIGESAANGISKEELRNILVWTAIRPGKGILRNAVLFASAFSVMMFAPLTPYITVGVFIAVMMVLSALFTILYLPSLIMIFRPWLFKNGVRT